MAAIFKPGDIVKVVDYRDRSYLENNKDKLFKVTGYFTNANLIPDAERRKTLISVETICGIKHPDPDHVFFDSRFEMVTPGSGIENNVEHYEIN